MATVISMSVKAQITFDVSEPEESDGCWNIQISMDNGNKLVTGFQCDIAVPKDYSYSMGNYSFTERCQKLVNGKYIETHTMIGTPVTNGGVIRIIVYSNDNSAIQDSEGEVITLRLDGLSTATAQDFNLTNIVVSTLNEQGKLETEAYYAPAVIYDDTLPCYDVMSSNVFANGVLSTEDIEEINTYLGTFSVIDTIDLSKCTNDCIGTLSLPEGSSPIVYLNHKGQITGYLGQIFYKHGDGWAVEKLTLSDEEPYTQENTLFVDELTFKRNFESQNWQAWYMPFSVEASQVNDTFLFAKITNITEDDEAITISIKEIEEGEISANTPYFVKVKTDNISSNNFEEVSIQEGVINSTTFTTANSTFTFTGTYSQKTDMYANQLFSLYEGELTKASSTDILKPYRWYLDYQTTCPFHKVCNIVYEKTVDSIENIAADKTSTAIHDISGRKVKALNKGIIITNGKKIIMR